MVFGQAQLKPIQTDLQEHLCPDGGGSTMRRYIPPAASAQQAAGR